MINYSFTRYLRPILVLIALGSSGPVWSQCSSSGADCIEIGRLNVSVSIGAGKRENPLREGEAIPLYLVPQFSFYGERFFLDNLDFGYTLLETEKHSLNLLASPGYDRVFFERHDPQNIVLDLFGASTISRSDGDPTPTLELVEEVEENLRNRSRKFTYLAGLEWSRDWGKIQSQISAGQDVTGAHGGQELRVAAALPLFSRHWQISASVGATWKSRDLVTYYYGDPDFIDLDAAWNHFIKINVHRKLSKHWDFRIIGHYERIGTSIQNSPIVDEKTIDTVFIGGTYHF